MRVRELLSVQVRPDIVDPKKTKVIFWFRSLLTDTSKNDDTQDEGENFTGEWFAPGEALGRLTWENDKKLVASVFSGRK